MARARLLLKSFGFSWFLIIRRNAHGSKNMAIIRPFGGWLDDRGNTGNDSVPLRHMRHDDSLPLLVGIQQNTNLDISHTFECKHTCLQKLQLKGNRLLDFRK